MFSQIFTNWAIEKLNLRANVLKIYNETIYHADAVHPSLYLLMITKQMDVTNIPKIDVFRFGAKQTNIC